MNERPPEGAAEAGGVEHSVVDPTNRLLGEVAGESRFPWIPVGIVALSLLWLASTPKLVLEPMRPAEIGWIAEAMHPSETTTKASALAHALTRATWDWQGVELDSARPLTPRERLAVRLPAAAAGFASLLVFFLLGRLVIGDGASLLAVCLLAIAAPWISAETSALPLLVGEMMVLLGVTWAIALHGRHREVSLVASTTLRIGVAGLFLGIGLLLAPATFAAFVTTLLLWFVLGLRRSSSDATTLPVERPRHIVLLAVIGTGVLVGATVLVSFVAEQLAGGSSTIANPLPILSTLVPEASVWRDVHRTLLSPGPRTDLLLLVTLGVIAIVRVLEKSAGVPWKAAGLLPWVYLGLHFYFAQQDAADVVGTSPFAMPITVGPLLVLGLGWTVLRGLRPGRTRRQEYGFALTWFVVSVLLAPFVPGGHPHDPLLAACVALLPPGLLIAARGARALWEAEGGPLGRAAIIAVAYLPVALFAGNAAAGLLRGAAPLDVALGRIQDVLPQVLLGVVALGVLSQLLTVRPDTHLVLPEPERHHGRRGRRGGRRGRRGRRPGAHHP
ncbi:MAG: hypothetical protein U0167_08085 [bacterium]